MTVIALILANRKISYISPDHFADANSIMSAYHVAALDCVRAALCMLVTSVKLERHGRVVVNDSITVTH